MFHKKHIEMSDIVLYSNMILFQWNEANYDTNYHGILSVMPINLLKFQFLLKDLCVIAIKYYFEMN